MFHYSISLCFEDPKQNPPTNQPHGATTKRLARSGGFVVREAGEGGRIAKARVEQLLEAMEAMADVAGWLASC